MERYHLSAEGWEGFTLERLSPAGLDAASELCDRCVGENLYPREFLATLPDRPEHLFYLLKTPEETAIGYIYFFLSGLAEMAALSKLPETRLSVISQKQNPVLGNIQSIAVSEDFRRRGLSRRLIAFSLERLEQMGADAAFGVCWKIHGRTPIEPTLTSLGFRYLSDSHLVWYDNPRLICPYCEGRCKCDAAVYYRPFGKETVR